MKPKYGSPFTNPSQELLIKACFAESPDFEAIYSKWKGQTDFEEDIEYGSFRLLPLLYKKLRDLKIEDELTPRLKGIYRKSWSQNHFLFRETGKVLNFLHQNNIETILIKGIPLSILSYRNYAVRPMADMDVMVHPEDAVKTFQLLLDKGWKSVDEVHDHYNLNHQKSITVIDEKKTELDLHWYPFDECYGLTVNTDFWDRAEEVVVSGAKTLAMCTADELLLSIVHGLMPNPVPPIRWIADAMTLISDKNRPVIWDRVIDYAGKFSVQVQLKTATKYLKETFGAPIPEDVYSRISNIKPTLADKLVYKRKGVFVYHPSLKKLFVAYISFLKNPAHKSLVAKNIAFFRYLRERSKGKPVFKILIYYVSVILKRRKSNR